jgi:hypothetical protein
MYETNELKDACGIYACVKAKDERTIDAARLTCDGLNALQHRFVVVYVYFLLIIIL